MNKKLWGNARTFLLLYSICNEEEGTSESASALEIENSGVIVKTTTEKSSIITESLVYVPEVRIEEEWDANEESVIGRKLVGFDWEEENSGEIDNELPDGLDRPDRPDQGLPEEPELPEVPDQGLPPGKPARPDQGLPKPEKPAKPDQTLPPTPEPK